LGGAGLAGESERLVIAVRFPRLYEALRALTVDTLQILDRDKPPRWPTRVVMKVVFDSAHSSHTEASTEECPGDLVAGMQSLLNSLPSYKDAVTELERMQQSGSSIPKFLAAGPSFTLPLLARYLDSCKSLGFDEAKFRETYAYVENYIGSDTVGAYLYVLIMGHSPAESEVKLSETHRIYWTDEREAQRLWKLITLPGPRWSYNWPIFTPHPQSYLLKAALTYTKQEGGNLAALLGDEEVRITRALRLSGLRGALQYLTYEDRGFSPFPFRFGAPGGLKQLQGSIDLGSDSHSLKQYWPVAYELAGDLRTNPESLYSHIRISALRFTTSFDKGVDEDRLIDYFIAFEALFTKENDAISYRLPLRVAIFVGDDAAERAKTFDIVRVGYDLRSNLAHGKSQLTDSVKLRDRKIPVREFMDRLREILFKSVHRFLACHKGTTKDVVIRAIDDAAVSQDRTALQKLWS
jgi:hypothetical protein